MNIVGIETIAHPDGVGVVDAAVGEKGPPLAGGDDRHEPLRVVVPGLGFPSEMK